MKKRVSVLGVKFDGYTQNEFLDIFRKRLAKREGTFVVTANPEIVMAARENKEFAHMVQQADFVTADGIGVVKAAAMLQTPLPERVTGYDLMTELLKIANENSYKVYLIGAKPEVIKETVKKVRHDYPKIDLVGFQDGYYQDDSKVIESVIQCAPQLVFAALGAPKQEEFLLKIRPSLSESFLMGVGGSFDVLSGLAKRAPKWMQKIHLEWFYRLIKEPSRWRRMLVLPKFLKLVKKESGSSAE